MKNFNVTTLPLRDNLQIVLSVLTIAATSFYAVLNTFLLHQFIFAAVQIVVVLTGVFTFIKAIKGQATHWHRVILLLIVTLNILNTFFFADLRAGSIFWCMLLPLVYYIMLGVRTGIFASLLVLGFVSVTLFMHSDTDHNIPYRVIINFSLCYFCVWYISYKYESVRMQNHLTLQETVMKDALTGLSNRHALTQFFDSLTQTQTLESVHLIILDVDHFKKINDKFGHDTGDRILIELADLLQDNASKDMLYRLGGEEFVVIVRNKSEQQVLEFAEQLRQGVEQHSFHSHDLKLSLTVSIGLSRFLPGQPVDDFLRSADKQLYMAKQNGRNLVCAVK